MQFKEYINPINHALRWCLKVSPSSFKCPGGPTLNDDEKCEMNNW